MNSRVVKLGRRYSLVRTSGAYVVFDTRKPARPGERFPASERARALLRYRVLEDRPGLRSGTLWRDFVSLERGVDLTGRVLGVTAAGFVGLILLIGLLETTAETRTASVLGAAFTVVESDTGVPYIAIDPHALGQDDGGSTKASGPEKGGGKGALSPILLFPVGDGFITFGGGDPPPGTDPKPGPGPQPSPGPPPSPSPSPGPDPSPPPPGPSPQPEPQPSQDPPPSPDPSPTPEPSPSPEPSPDPSPSPDPPPEPSPTPDPSPTSQPPPTGPTGPSA